MGQTDMLSITDSTNSCPTNQHSLMVSITAANPSEFPCSGRGSPRKKVHRYAPAADGLPPVPLRCDGKKKRVHPTKEQAAILERHFQSNQKPNAKQRADICRQVNINSKSVQIWFQNRRAKHRKDADIDAASPVEPDASFPTHHVITTLGNATPQAPLNPHGDHVFNPKNGSLAKIAIPEITGFPFPASPESPVLSTLSMTTASAAASEIGATSFDTSATFQGISAIAISSWLRQHRPASADSSVALKLDLLRSSLIYEFSGEMGTTWRMEVLLAWVSNVYIAPASSPSEECSVLVDITQPPLFSYSPSNTAEFIACTDFTEASEASVTARHSIYGTASDLEHFFFMLSSQVALMKAHLDLQQSMWKYVDTKDDAQLQSADNLSPKSAGLESDLLIFGIPQYEL